MSCESEEECIRAAMGLERASQARQLQAAAPAVDNQKVCVGGRESTIG